MKKWVIIGVCAIALIYLTVSRINSKNEAEKTVTTEKTVSVTTSAIEKGSIEGKLFYTGTVEGIHEAMVVSQTSGVAEKIGFELGKRVSQGQTLATIENTMQRAAVEQAKAAVLAAESNHEKAKIDLKRMQKLQAENVATRDNLEMAEVGVKSALAQVRAAEAGLKAAEKALADTYIKATIPGVVATREIDRGATVAPGTKIAFITDVSKVKVRIMVAETDIVSLKEGKEVEIKIDALPGEKFEGKITNIGYSSEVNMRSYPVEITIPNTKDVKIKSGMFARCEITSQTKDNTMLLPEDAIVTSNDQTTSVFVSEGGVAKSKPVKTGLKNAGKVEILSGLTGNERVVVFGKERLSEGTQVKEN